METISLSSASLTCLIRKKRSGNPRQQREKLVNAVDDKSARHAAADLMIDEAVRVGMDQNNLDLRQRRDAHLVVKFSPG